MGLIEMGGEAMAREKIGSDVMKVRFADGVFDRIDAVSDNRSEFIRDAVYVALALVEDEGKRNHVNMRKEGITDCEISRFGGVQLSEPVDAHTLPKADPAVPRKASGSLLRDQDEADLIAALRKKPMSPRDAEKVMGWLGLRYSNAEKALLASGVVKLVNGILEVSDE